MTKTTSASRVRRRREVMRAAGLRPIQIWVPNIREPGFAEECRRQCLAVATAETEESRTRDQAWYAISDTTGWTD